ncbi:hypothetical protein MTO96_032372 [Rhipicephalus appendiculatus]
MPHLPRNGCGGCGAGNNQVWWRGRHTALINEARNARATRSLYPASHPQRARNGAAWYGGKTRTQEDAWFPAGRIGKGETPPEQQREMKGQRSARHRKDAETFGEAWQFRPQHCSVASSRGRGGKLQ